MVFLQVEGWFKKLTVFVLETSAMMAILGAIAFAVADYYFVTQAEFDQSIAQIQAGVDLNILESDLRDANSRLDELEIEVRFANSPNEEALLRAKIDKFERLRDELLRRIAILRSTKAVSN